MNIKSRARPHTAQPTRKPDAGSLRWINGLAAVRAYRLPWLPHDLLAGVTLSAVLVPAGMAYANAAGLPAVSGLYASFAAMLAYALFGPSRILVLGPDSALAAIILGVIAPLAGGDPLRAATLAEELRQRRLVDTRRGHPRAEPIDGEHTGREEDAPA